MKTSWSLTTFVTCMELPGLPVARNNWRSPSNSDVVAFGGNDKEVRFTSSICHVKRYPAHSVFVLCDGLRVLH